MNRVLFLPTLVVLALVGLAAYAQQGESPDAEKEQPPDAAAIVLRSQRAFYYPGDDMLAKVTMELIDRDRGTRKRVMTMLRRNDLRGDGQRYFIYFHEPGDVRRMTFMVFKYPEREDDRWIFVPAVDLIRRIAADDKRSSFVGSDFTYEDVSGRDTTAENHSLLREEKLGDRDCYVIASRDAGSHTKRVSWIDRENLLPLKEEYYDAQGELSRVSTADKVEEVKAGEGDRIETYPTVTRRTMRDVKSGHRTEVSYTSVTYNLGLKREDFSERRMRRPPRSWIK